MPELPEVETVCRGIAPLMLDRKIRQLTVFRSDLRVPFPVNLSESVEHKVIVSVSRRAKYILIQCEDATILIIHLGMSGSIRHYPHKRNQLLAHDHMVLDMDSGIEIVFNDPRRFGLVALANADTLDMHPLFSALGPEPFSDHFTGAYLHGRFAKRTMPVKTAVMDNHIVVGVGNIYAAESLFQAHILPTRPANDLTLEECGRLVVAIRSVLEAAIASGGSTLRNYVQSSGELGYFQHQFFVYGREGKSCFVCNTPIHKITQGGRSTFYCSKCQQ